MWFDDRTAYLLLLAFAATRSVVSADRLEDLVSAVRDSTTVDTISETASRVVIRNVTCDVYVHAGATVGRTADGRESAAKFYTCVNCVFAGWLQDQLIELVGRFPALYQPALLSRYDGGAARRLFDGSDDSLDRITGYAARFVNVLFNLADAFTRASMVDASFLRTLLSFGFAVDYLEAAHARNPGLSDNAAISRILRTVNAAQKFRAFNCDVGGPFYDDAPFFGYARPRPAVTDGPGIGRFLRDVRPARLETHLERCRGGQMLLLDVLASDDDVVARELYSAHARVECPRGRYPPAIDVRLARKVARTHDLDVMLWYQKVVYDALLKMLCTKIKQWAHLPFWTWPVEIRKGFDVLRFVWAESTDAPPALVRVLSLLAAGKPLNRGDEALVMKTVSEFVKFQTPVPPPETPPLRLPSSDVSVIHSPTNSDLEPFMDAIINKVDDYKCFVRLFRTLNADYRKYYMPHARDMRRVYDFVNREACEVKDGASGSGAGGTGSRVGGKKPETAGGSALKTGKRGRKPKMSEITETWIEPVAGTSRAAVPDGHGPVKEIRRTLDAADMADDVCSALIGMYQYCFETLLELNDCRAAERREPGAGRSCLPEVGKNIGAVVRYAYIASASSLRDHCVNKMSFDMTTVQMFAGNRLWQDGLYDELQRHLYVIMAELNECGLKFCRPPKYNYLLFNNVDMSSTGQHGRFHAWWTGFMRTVGLDPDAKLPKLDVLNEEYRANAGVFERYKNAVKLPWKGEMMSVDEIFRNVSYTLSNPDYAYALYDVYFGISAVAIYYETLLLFEKADIVYDPNTMRPQSGIDVFNVIVNGLLVDENSFPPIYQTLITDHNENASRVLERIVPNARFQILPSVSKAQHERFDALNIFIDMDHYDLSDARAASEFTWDKKDSFMSSHVNECMEIVKKIGDSALKVKKAYTEFVDYYISSIPELSLGR